MFDFQFQTFIQKRNAINTDQSQRCFNYFTLYTNIGLELSPYGLVQWLNSPPQALLFLSDL